MLRVEPQLLHRLQEDGESVELGAAGEVHSVCDLLGLAGTGGCMEVSRLHPVRGWVGRSRMRRVCLDTAVSHRCKAWVSCELFHHSTTSSSADACRLHYHYPHHRPPRWPSGKVSASRAEDPGFESRLRRDFFGVESYQ